MAIQLQGLTINQSEKTVREYISTPTGNIEIYEPTIEMANELLEIQEKIGFDFSQDKIEFDAVVLLKEVFPLLTNIETGDLPDDELQKIIENPSIHLLIAQNIVAQIISEVNKLYTERMKAEIASAETLMATTDMLTSIPNIVNERVKRDENLSQSLREIEEKTAEVEKLMKEDAEKEESHAPEVVEENAKES